MDRDQLVMGLAAVFAGLTMLLVVLSFTHQLFLLAVAVPFAATTYFMWYQASGRMAERTRTRRVRSGPEGFGGFGSDGGFRAGADPGRRNPGGGFGAASNGRQRVPGGQPTTGPSPEEAYRTLGLDADASQEEVKQAYRRKVKEVHPDTESGDEESFKRVNRAYERLTAESSRSR